MPVVQVPFGSGTSPVVAGDLVILNRQEPKEPLLVGAEPQDGGGRVEAASRDPVGLPIAFGSHSTPLIVEGQVVIHGHG